MNKNFTLVDCGASYKYLPYHFINVVHLLLPWNWSIIHVLSYYSNDCMMYSAKEMSSKTSLNSKIELRSSTHTMLQEHHKHQGMHRHNILVESYQFFTSRKSKDNSWYEIIDYWLGTYFLNEYLKGGCFCQTVPVDISRVVISLKEEWGTIIWGDRIWLKSSTYTTEMGQWAGI